MVFEFILGAVGLVCAILVIYDVFAVQKNMTMPVKVLWTVLAIFFSIITAIIYFLFIKKKR
jgi:predicted outer membrane lipoprotein